MQFAFETKKDGIISVTADIVDGEFKVTAPLAENLGKRERSDIIEVAKQLYRMELEDAVKKDIRNYK